MRHGLSAIRPGVRNDPISGLQAFLTRHAGRRPDQLARQIGAAVALYRVVQWAMPIPIGWGVVWWWRRAVGAGRLPDPFAIQAGEASDSGE